jgi:hypothetical protein
MKFLYLLLGIEKKIEHVRKTFRDFANVTKKKRIDYNTVIEDGLQKIGSSLLELNSKLLTMALFQPNSF